MKTLTRYSVITAIAAPLLLSACADNDVYDPNKVRPVPPVENPLGDDFVAPDGFDWSMIATVKLNVEVKDELNGQYNYLAEVFTTNPLIDKTATPIAAGYAKGGTNFVAEISIPKSTERLFIRQTDPKQRKEIYEYAVPENGGTLNSKLYYAGGVTTKVTTGSTSASDAAIAAGAKELEDKNYTEEAPVIPEVPEKSDEPVSQYNPNIYNNGARILIAAGEESNKIYQMQNGKGTIFVKGTFKATQLNGQFDIYVLDGGKVEFAIPYNFDNVQKFVAEKGSTVQCTSNFSTSAGEWYLGGDFIANGNVTFQTPSLTIASGAQVSVNNGVFNPCSNIVKNFGSITASELICNQGTPEFYSTGTIEVANDMRINKTEFTNKGSLVVGGKLTMNSHNNVLNKGKISVHEIDLTSSTFSNYGELLIDEENGVFNTNRTSDKAHFINHYEGTVKGYHLQGGLSFYNDGFVEFTLFENGGTDMLYNSCTLIVKEHFTWSNVTLDNGSITGGKPDDMSSSENNASQWKPVPEISHKYPFNFLLKNGSMIKSTLFNVDNAPSTIKGEGNNPSLLQFERAHFTNGGTTEVSDLVVEMPENAFTYGSGFNGVNNAKWITSGVSTTGWEESKYTFSTCGGYYSPGNPGNPTPETPKKPDIEDNTVYTYAFEDQWPAYGDFDMNDVVISIDKMTATDENKKLTIKGRVRAVGSSRKTGVGIQFLNISNSEVVLSGRVQSGTPVFESNQNNPVVIISTNVHKYCNPGIADDDFTFYSTEPSNSSEYNGDGAEFEIIMTFSSAEEALKAMNVKNLDVFIISHEAQGNVGRTEVHMANYAPTNLGNTGLFGMANDASAENTMLNVSRKGYYISTEGLAWGICIPNSEVWSWPREYKMITDVYPDFKNWVINGGKTEDLDWINNHNNDIFVKP